MIDHILGNISPTERKRIRKLYRSIIAGKSDVTTLSYDDATRIEAKIQSKLLCVEAKSIQYNKLIGQLSKRESRLLPIYDSVVKHRMLKEAELVFEVFGDNDGIEAAPPIETEPSFCPWAVVDDRTRNLYLAVHRDEISLEELDFADQCVVMSMKENRKMLSTFVAQIQSVIDAADEGKMNLNTLSFENMQTLAKAIDQIVSE